MGEAAESMQMLAHDAKGWEGVREVWERLRKAGRCLRMMQKGGEGSVGEAAESKQMLAHDAKGWGEGREAWGRLRNAGRCLRMMQKGGRRERGREVRGRLRETCIEAVREQTFGEIIRFCAV